MKSNPTNLELISETVPVSASGVRNAGRFQVIVEYAAGVCIPAAVAQSREEAVEAFMIQMPGCEEGEIALFDREEQRVVAFVKWKMTTTELGFPTFHRVNVFHDWHLALLACQNKKQVSLGEDVQSGSLVCP
ncbi:MAG: hypothetical protein JNK23_12625 [Opitutaceae bacterium]|nr:hypothetical protein [Opitutaceae bacterium]